MLPHLLSLEVDLAVENGGHLLRLRGQSPKLIAEIESFPAVLHFLRAGWPLRTWIPAGLEVEIRWWVLRWTVRGPQ
jgi:hypothetical protein